jgi:molybdopterin/thiamine biosynthesis adenylyltransferase
VDLAVYLRRSAEGAFLPWAAQLQAADTFGVTVALVEETALSLGLLPARYRRNQKTISTAAQLSLFRSRVAVIGCGGLGGFVIEELARLGVGEIRAVDFDVFEEHNLNRQILATFDTLGRAKAQEAAARAAKTNPAVRVIPVSQKFEALNSREILAGVDLVVDALDSIPVRLELEKACSALGITLVHGAICGWFGQVATVYPGDDTLHKIYGACPSEKGMEAELGNPSFTPAVVASLQAAEACKVILAQGNTLRHRVLFINLLAMEMEEVSL